MNDNNISMRKNYNMIVAILNDAGFYLNMNMKKGYIYVLASNDVFVMTEDKIKNHLTNFLPCIEVSLCPDPKVAQIKVIA